MARRPRARNYMLKRHQDRPLRVIKLVLEEEPELDIASIRPVSAEDQLDIIEKLMNETDLRREDIYPEADIIISDPAGYFDATERAARMLCEELFKPEDYPEKTPEELEELRDAHFDDLMKDIAKRHKTFVTLLFEEYYEMALSFYTG